MQNTITGECNTHGNVVALCPFCQIEALERAKAELKELQRAHAFDQQKIRDLEARLAIQS